MPCERLFSGTKQVAVDRRARLGSVRFEELTIMGSAWGPDIYDLAAWNNIQREDINLLDFEQMLIEDVDVMDWEKDL